MEHQNYDTSKLWETLLFLISLVLILVLLAFGYLILEDSIESFINKPKYSQEQLEAYSKKREIARRQERNDDWDLVENGIHVKTGLIDDVNLKVVIGSCTSCHSPKLITQNRATRDGWKNMILWMQKTQGLNDLGVNEPIVLDYLAKHYAPQEVGRRKNLDIAAIEWYVLNLNEE